MPGKELQDSVIFIVRKREAKADKEEELPFSMCRGLFKGSLICKHRTNCFMRRTVTGTHITSTSRIILNSELAQDTFHDFSTEILANMKRGDEYRLCIRNDPLLLLFGSIEMQRKESNQYKDIRYTRRCIAKLMIEFKKVANLEDVSAQDLISPQNFENIVIAVKNLSGYKDPRKIKTPHITLKLGFSLKTLADIASLKHLKEGLDPQVSKCEKFLMLYEKEYSIYAKNATAVYNKRKAYIPEELPEEEHIKKVRRYCIQEALSLCESIKKEGFTPEKYRQLAKVTLVCLITFNARRGSEPSKLELRDWEGVKYGRWKRITDIEKLSDPVEVTLSKRLRLCYVEGKKKRAKGNALVSILFTKETVDAIDLLMEHRQDMGILPNNKYVFAGREGKNYTIGWDTLQSIAK